MRELFFVSSIVAEIPRGGLLIPLFNGAAADSASRKCVVLLTCSRESGIALAAGLCSALKLSKEQSDAHQ